MGTAVKVSIVEDDPVIRSLTAQRVARLGFTVHSQYENGEDALAQLQKSLPDIVIMDIDLGGEIDGIDVALRLQELRAAIPFVFVTAHRDQETISRVKMVQAAEYIVKPFTDDGLRIALGLALDKQNVLSRIGKQQDLHEMLLGQFFGAIIATDTRGVILYINERGRVMTKWKGRIDGMTHFREIVRIQDSTTGIPLENIADRILADRRILWLPPNSSLVALDKNPVQVMGSASPLTDTSGTIQGMIVVLYPVSNPMYLEFRGRPLY